jgi:transcriptional regulator
MRSMHVPKHFALNDERQLLAFAEAHSFATLVSQSDATGIVASHVPVLVDRAESGWIIEGHVARANPQPLTGEALVIFSGPHAYISPSWYVEANQVPTWNYLAVHVTGSCERIDRPDELRTIVRRLTAQHEAGLPNPWEPHLPPDLESGLLSGITGFRVVARDIRGAWKLNQNKSLESRSSVARALRQRGSDDERSIADWIERMIG